MSPALPWRRWTIAAALLLAEYLVLTFVYDVGMLRSSSWLIGHSGLVAPVAFLSATAMLVLWRAPRPEVIAAVAAAAQGRRTRWLIAHVASALIFFPLSHRVLSRPGVLPLPTPSSPSLAAWVASGAAVVATAIAFAFPRRAARPLAQLAGRPAIAGVVVAIAAWGAGLEAQWLWPWLARATLSVAAAIMAPLAGPDLIVDLPGRLLGFRNFVAEIGDPCSGAEGMGLVGVLAAAYLVKFRATLIFPRALLVVPIAMAGAFFGNVARIVALVWIGAVVTPDVALQGFHSKAGWVMTCLIAVGVLAWVRRSPWLNRARAIPDDGENPTVAYLAPLLASAALSLVTGLFSTGFDRLFGVRVVGTALALIAVRGAFVDPTERPRPTLLPAAVGLLVFLGWLALARRAEPATIATLQAGLASMSSFGRWLWLVARVVGAVVIAPLAEELAFRGFLLRRLVRDDFWDVGYAAAARRPVAVAVSALIFGALHGAFVAGTLAGLAYALLLRRRGRLGDAILAHATTNALLVVYTLATGDWAFLA